MKWNKIWLIFLYLIAIIVANLLVVKFGPKVIVIGAFFLIGFDLTARDGLHELWGGKWMWLKMFALILSGSILSFILNKNSLHIAIASLVAFLAAGIADALIYHFLRRKKWMIKVNGSNMASAMLDSMIFPTLAFGALMPLVILGQFSAKLIGGLMWSLVLKRFSKKSVVESK